MSDFALTIKALIPAVAAGLHLPGTADRRQQALLLIFRLLFLKYVEQRGLFAHDRNYLAASFAQHSDNYWQTCLQPLIQTTLPTLAPDWAAGLFAVNDEVCNLLFNRLLAPFAAAACDEAALGAAYASLIAERQTSGIYYTEPREVALMCCESLRAYLEMHCPTVAPGQIAALLAEPAAVTPTPAVARSLASALLRLRSFDPAMGAGTFPLALLHLLRTLLETLAAALPTAALPAPAERTAQLLNGCIHGCDSDPVAVTITRLRCWMVLLADSGHSLCLPDLTTRLVTGDALTAAFSTDAPFDIVIGNPPYVRQERLAASLAAAGLKLDKPALRRHFARTTGCDPGGQADLYIYFFLRALQLLRPASGVLCFISPNSWLNAGYGAAFQRHLLERVRLRLVIENRACRSFSQADVNTVITLATTPPAAPAGAAHTFAVFEQSFAAYDLPATCRALVHDGQIPAGLRVQRRSTADLLRLGYDESQSAAGEYRAAPWGGLLLRAPAHALTLYERARRRAVPLAQLAGLQRGVTTGANEFFFLTVVESDPALPAVRCRTLHGSEFVLDRRWLRPAVCNTRAVQTFVVEADTLRARLFVADATGAPSADSAAFVAWGEAQGYHSRPTCASRNPWWRLRLRPPRPLWWIIAHHDRDGAFLNSGAWAGDNFFELTPAPGVPLLFLFGVLNSSWAVLQRELFGRSGFGGGLLKTQGPELRRMLLPDPRLLPADLRDPISEAAAALHQLAPQPIAATWNHQVRRRLDEAVAGALGLSPTAATAVHAAACELTAERIQRARR